ncbi:LPXTG cell wall anchor domain-containing protein [Candidatus Enterococcus mansonii]|uniref:Gram-positive cocci surface proteins LPxTG domain-containing protein n=1 Tax=Candidatus Enterococcus mansonii TaxID=1834181 RepID=A0A242CG91_9ENTE|nr:LPXTG cell wall anchor domain-containing protein [Enterococcus sp. 4G2_DIV0659]OTO08940.1 hypothetical protein A5880_001940 [Enterococcus sp. 4G2_DIV0659]
MKVYKKYLSFVILLTLVGVSAFGFSYSTLAEENGGAVQTNGNIQFYEESSSSSSTTTSTTETPIKKPKPVGRFPSTGELVQKSMVFTGGLLLLILLYILIRHKRKSNGKESD